MIFLHHNKQDDRLPRRTWKKSQLLRSNYSSVIKTIQDTKISASQLVSRRITLRDENSTSIYPSLTINTRISDDSKTKSNPSVVPLVANTEETLRGACKTDFRAAEDSYTTVNSDETHKRRILPNQLRIECAG